MVANAELSSIQTNVSDSERQRATDLAVRIITANKGIILDNDSNPLLREVRAILGPQILQMLIATIKQQ